MVDRIQGSSSREGISGRADAQPYSFNHLGLVEVVTFLAHDRFRVTLDEAMDEVSQCDKRLGEISRRIQRLISLQQESNEEIDQTLKEVESDPSLLEWELNLVRFIQTHRFTSKADKIEWKQKIALEIAKWLAGKVGQLAPSQGENDFHPEALPMPGPGQESVEAIQSVQPPAQCVASIAASYATHEPRLLLPCPETRSQGLSSPSMPGSGSPYPGLPYLGLPCSGLACDEHRYTKMDEELHEVKRSLEQLRASIKVIQENQLQKNRPLVARLFDMLAALFGRIFPGLNSGRKIVDVRMRQTHAQGA